MKKNLKTKIVTLAAAFVVIVGATSAFASEGDTTDTDVQRGGQGSGNHFERLVEEGIISEDTLEAIIEYQEENQDDHQAEREAEKALVDELTDEEREEYFESKDEVNPLDELVEAGILTEDEADTIAELNETMKAEGPARGEKPERGEKSEDGERPNHDDEEGRGMGKGHVEEDSEDAE